MKETIGVKRVKEEFAILVKKRGKSFRYNGGDQQKRCEYVRSGRPSCAVGVMAYQIDPNSLSTLKSFNTEGITNSALLKALPFRLTDAAVRTLEQIQGSQDYCVPYGNILERIGG